MTLGVGLHDDVLAADYHADPCPEPSLSGTLANTLLTRSPLHAWAEHPRLNPQHEPIEPSAPMDFGTAAHALLLQGLDICHVIDADDWRKPALREERDKARLEGLVPLLRKDYDRMCELCLRVGAQLSRLDVRPVPLRDGTPERTLVWQEEGGVWCRARLDWLHADWDVVDDLKTTGTQTGAHPTEWARTRLWVDGRDVQAAFYRRGLRAVADIDAAWRFVIAETDRPFAVSVIGLSPSAMELADRKAERAIQLWRECMEAGDWPGYERGLVTVDAPWWVAERFERAHPETMPA